MSTTPVDRAEPVEIVAGYMSAAAIFLGAMAIVVRPLPIGLAAIVLSLVGTAMGGRWGRLHALAVGAATVGFVLGMTVAVLTSSPLY